MRFFFFFTFQIYLSFLLVILFQGIGVLGWDSSFQFLVSLQPLNLFLITHLEEMFLSHSASLNV